MEQQNSNEITSDPSFFRMIDNVNNRSIYVLGCAHVFNIEDSVSKNSLEELKRIGRTENPMLFIEHNLNNEHGISLLTDEYKTTGSSSLLESKYEFLLEDKILLTENNQSGVTISELFSYDSWIVAPILSIHYGLLFYQNFGGTEYSLENNVPWKDFWNGVHQLEGKEHYEIMRYSSQDKKDEDYNKVWISNTLNKLTLINPLLDRLFPFECTDFENEKERKSRIIKEKEICNNEMSQLLEQSKKNYLAQGCEVLEFDALKMPTSPFERNKLWIKNLRDLSDKSSNLLLVVGNAHLAGFNQKQSFLYLLYDFIKPRTIERFVNESGSWTSIFVNIEKDHTQEDEDY